LVIEKSNEPKNMGINLLIENCSKGEKKNIKKRKKNKKIKKAVLNLPLLNN
jgi:hypothetical protein